MALTAKMVAVQPEYMLPSQFLCHMTNMKLTGKMAATGVCTTEYLTNLYVPYLLSNAYKMVC